MKKIIETLKRKWPDYLLEIIVIVLSIFGALELENWNENRKTKITEQAYLIALKEEFLYNQSELERSMKRNKRNLDSAAALSNFIGLDKTQITEKRLASLLLGTTLTEVQFRPSTGVLNEIISSGKLAIFSNQQLRYTLSSWDGTVMKVRFQEQEHATIRSKILEIWISSGNLRKTIPDKWAISFKKNDFIRGNLHLLHSEEFDNQIIMFILTGKFLNGNYYTGLQNEIEKILTIIDEELAKA